MTPKVRDHGGGLDAAIEKFGGKRADWLDLSTGINPVPYPVGDIDPDAWTALPDKGAEQRLVLAARKFWSVPAGGAIVAAPGASALIARLPYVLGAPQMAWIKQPTYNEWQAAFENAGWQVSPSDAAAPVHVHVHPNNPDGVVINRHDICPDSTVILDESFCDTMPTRSHVTLTGAGPVIAIKSFGKFWGLAGVRLGFAIGPEKLVSELKESLGPWPVSGPAISIAARALADNAWAEETRQCLQRDAARLDGLMAAAGAGPASGTDLFRLYNVDDAAAWQDKLARAHVWSRIFPYSPHMLRLGLPAPDRWPQLIAAL